METKHNATKQSMDQQRNQWRYKMNILKQMKIDTKFFIICGIQQKQF